jgi:sucrose phosphorylase
MNENRIREYLVFLYGEPEAEYTWNRLQARLTCFRQQNPHFLEAPFEKLNQRDAVLITYGDQVSEVGVSPLRTLAEFLATHIDKLVSSVHVLPFYPYSSDDGFSVIDYRKVNPAFGEWEDIAHLGLSYRLMFDAVVNHISRESEWFQAYQKGKEPYTDYFITLEPDTDLSAVFRPRATPLLTPVETPQGMRYVWTTFSVDQVDLNFANPEVLFEIIDLLLFYIERGAGIIRLDAIAYLWKEIGTSCIHLPQTHAVIKLFRSVIDSVAPGVILITETNVPHDENISYFGDGTDEAQMVYNFTLPPLTLHTFHTGNAETLTRWASTLDLPSDETTFFNFLASHDGIGVTPLRGWLSEIEMASLLDRVQALGGRVSYKSNPDGTQSPYEMNINYLDALGDPLKPDPNPATLSQRFLASQAIMLALRGVPGIYIHSLLASRNWTEGVKKLGYNRAINREKLSLQTIQTELNDSKTFRSLVFSGYKKLLKVRAECEAFHPNGAQKILSLHPSVFALRRISPDGSSHVLALHNVSDQPQTITLPVGAAGKDLVENKRVSGGKQVTLSDYQVMWILADK